MTHEPGRSRGAGTTAPTEELRAPEMVREIRLLVEAAVPPPNSSDLATALESAGFWDVVPEPERRRLAADVASGGDPVDPMYEYGWRADGEDLAEGDVEELLRDVAQSLALRGVVLDVGTVEGPYDDGTEGYAISINGQVVDLYRHDPAEDKLPASEDPWMDCTLRPIGVVNALLASAGSSNRLAVFSPGGNDGLILLLSDRAVDLLRNQHGELHPNHPVVP